MRGLNGLVVSLTLGLVGCTGGDSVGPTPDCDCPEPVATPDVGAVAAEPAPLVEAPATPGEAECTTFVDHMAVVVAQSLGVPAKNLFTPGERSGAVEHCKRYAHPNLMECGRQTQVLAHFQACLFATAVPRPEVEHATKPQCEAYNDRVREITHALQGRTMGFATPPVTSERGDQQSIAGCMANQTPDEVKCGTEAGSQLSLFSCFSPYEVDERTWPSAEECEGYGDHMAQLLGSYLLLPMPKPQDAFDAVMKSGLGGYAMPQTQRFQLVNLCHQLDRELVQCHRKAATAADLAVCVP